jgi:predicted ester cyclase
MTMTPEPGTANALAEAAWAGIRAGRIEDLAGIFAPDAEMRIAAMGGRGIDHIMGVMGRHRESYPDITHEIVSVIESPDGTSACRELQFSGTQTGQLKNPQTGEIYPPSGKVISWHAAEVVQAADGRITAWHAYFDRMEIAQQLRDGQQPGNGRP